MFKKLFCIFLSCVLLSSCASIGVKYEYVKVKGNTIKACNFQTLGDARRQSTIQYLEENGVSINTNNNTICNSLGCIQEEEIRLFSKNTLNLKQTEYDEETDCVYFKANKINKKHSKEVDINHEGRFDISNESSYNLISINVMNIREPVWARMNGRLMLINGADISIKGATTLKFEVETEGFEKKVFTIKTNKKSEKIIKNITLVRKSRKVKKQEDLEYGFKLIKKNGECRTFFGLFKCKGSVDEIVNDTPFDVRMLNEKLNDQRDSYYKGRDLYYVFSDINLHRAVGFKIHSYVNDGANLIVNINPYPRRGKEFKKLARQVSRRLVYKDIFEIPNGNNGDTGTSPFIETSIEISLYDKFGKFVEKKTLRIPMCTNEYYPEYKESLYPLDSHRAEFYGYYMDEYELRYKINVKFAPRGAITQNKNGHVVTSWARGVMSDRAFQLLKKYLPKR